MSVSAPPPPRERTLTPGGSAAAPLRPARLGARVVTALAIALATALVAFLILPLLGLGVGLGDLGTSLSHPLVWPALRLSLVTTLCSLGLIVLCGTPLAWWLASRSGRLASALEAVLQLPIVVPPAVAGIALLLAFGRHGFLAELTPGGDGLAFSTLAVVLAQVFVAAPFYVQAAVSAFRRVDRDILLAAQSLGASPLRTFLRIALPLSLPGLVAGAALSWARALGEFGATLMFAGNLPGRSQTLPLAIYEALERDLDAARALAILLLIAALFLLIGVRALTPRPR